MKSRGDLCFLSSNEKFVKIWFLSVGRWCRSAEDFRLRKLYSVDFEPMSSFSKMESSMDARLDGPGTPAPALTPLPF